AGNDGTARVWEVSTGREVTAVLHEKVVTAVTFSPDGGHLATARLDGTARVWEVKGRQEIVRLPHEGYVQAVAFVDPGAKFVASANGTIVLAPGETLTDRPSAARVWLWRPDDLVSEACSRLSRNLTPEEWR